ncbi:hypothetical protein P691DRAFT_610098, partial [Macrolepiota fuliginosa MF-IS2]
RIIDEYKNNSFSLNIPAELKQQGIHPAFHANLLWIHIPNNNRQFPRRQLPQVVGLGQVEEWSIDRIITHTGKGKDSVFHLQYKTGDRVWLLYYEVSSLEAITQYFELLGVTLVANLPR